MNVSKVIDHDCSGCGSCSLICPKESISLKKNTDGFFSANIDMSLCVECGRCVKVCPRIKKNEGNELISATTIAAKVRDKSELLKSSSGGIAFLLYRIALQNQWAVIGSYYDNDSFVVRGKVAFSEKEALPFRGSKYLQCDFTEAFRSCIDLAKKDITKHFLIIGMPCQIAGLHMVLTEEKIRDQFLLVDMFCHGVPSYLIWDEYCRNIHKKTGDYPDNINFRSKRFGWGSYCVEYDSGKKHYISPGSRDFFINAFFDDILLNFSCMDCSYRQAYSVADIRIGDFWGTRFRSSADGVSSVLLFTDRGKKFWESVPEDVIELLCECSTEECIMSQSINPYKPSPLREQAFKELRNGENVRKVINNYRRKFSHTKKQKRFAKWVLSFFPNDGRSIKRIILKIKGR